MCVSGLCLHPLDFLLELCCLYLRSLFVRSRTNVNLLFVEGSFSLLCAMRFQYSVEWEGGISHKRKLSANYFLTVNGWSILKCGQEMHAIHIVSSCSMSASQPRILSFKKKKTIKMQMGNFGENPDFSFIMWVRDGIVCAQAHLIKCLLKWEVILEHDDRDNKTTVNLETLGETVKDGKEWQ